MCLPELLRFRTLATPLTRCENSLICCYDPPFCSFVKFCGVRLCRLCSRTAPRPRAQPNTCFFLGFEISPNKTAELALYDSEGCLGFFHHVASLSLCCFSSPRSMRSA